VLNPLQGREQGFGDLGFDGSAESTFEQNNRFGFLSHQFGTKFVLFLLFLFVSLLEGHLL